jgi:CPA1 family monovalent cation:H+ antiporter
MSPSTRLAVESFWEYVAFALNSLVFLLIGFEVPLSSLLHAWKPITVAFLAVTLGRAAVVLITTLILQRTRERVPLRWAAVLTWGGLRGGLSMVLALGLPTSLAHRDLIITMTFGAVVLSILVQGLTMAPLLRRLGLVRGREDRARYEAELATQLALKASLAALASYRDRGGVHPEVADALRTDYSERLDASVARVSDLRLADETLRDEEERGLRRRLLLVERDTVSRAMREGVVGTEAAESLLRDIDARILEATELGHE